MVLIIASGHGIRGDPEVRAFIRRKDATIHFGDVTEDSGQHPVKKSGCQVIFVVRGGLIKLKISTPSR